MYVRFILELYWMQDPTKFNFALLLWLHVHLFLTNMWGGSATVIFYSFCSACRIFIDWLLQGLIMLSPFPSPLFSLIFLYGVFFRKVLLEDVRCAWNCKWNGPNLFFGTSQLAVLVDHRVAFFFQVFYAPSQYSIVVELCVGCCLRQWQGIYMYLCVWPCTKQGLEHWTSPF